MEEQKQQQPASKKAIPILAIVISSLVIVGLIGYFGYVLLYPSFAPKFPEKRTCDNARDCRGYCDIPKDQQTGTFTGIPGKTTRYLVIFSGRIAVYPAPREGLGLS